MRVETIESNFVIIESSRPKRLSFGKQVNEAASVFRTRSSITHQGK